jgi:nitrogen regulatory protein P-II 1
MFMYLTLKEVFVKELVIYVISEDLPKVSEILHKHNAGGMVFYEVNGRGRIERDQMPEMVRSYMTGRKVTPEFAKRTKIETVVTDSAAEEIIGEITNSIGSESDPRGMIFVKDVSSAYEIGTKKSGDMVLAPR